jgi:hypothetical protein
LEDRFDLNTVLSFGTFPSFIDKDDGEKRQILTTYVEIYFREEIKAEGIARNLSGFSRFLDVAAIEIKSLRHITSADCSGLRSFHEDYPLTPLFIGCIALNRYDLNGITVYPWQELMRALHDLM